MHLSSTIANVNGKSKLSTSSGNVTIPSVVTLLLGRSPSFPELLIRRSSTPSISRTPHQRSAIRVSKQEPLENVDRRGVILSMGVMSLLEPQLSALADECELVSSPSGIQYCDDVIGSGNEVHKGTLIRAHYTGRLASDLKVFDSSYPRGRPLVFKIGAGDVIKGWDMGILGTDGIPPMKAGGKRRLVIPPEYAYGSRGAGRGLIPPNATLIFDVEYLGEPSRK